MRRLFSRWKPSFFHMIATAFILIEAGVIAFLMHRKHIFIQVEAKTSWGTLLGPYAAPVAGLFGGSVALWTYNRSHFQKQEHFDRQQVESKVQFDRKALADEFSDILNRFSSDKPIIRANAAIRLAEMAETHRPGAPLDFTYVRFASVV